MASRRTTASPKSSPVPRTAKPRKRRATVKPPVVTADERRGMIAYSAYLRAERRGFGPGGEAEDWLAAEKEVDALLNGAHSAAQ
ncbi:MAG TPA: DUF2934 domain-containing protein [Steroidobacteraceae bacterium]|nr:DUF2934 domain-containing protein [Steroidobacteraceae bacterium]